MQINDIIWHPCSMDILEFKIISIRELEISKQYVLKSTRCISVCGTIEVLVQENRGELRFVELLDAEYEEYSDGLQDFLEGFYYKTKTEARLEFYKQQKVLAYSNWDEKRRLCEEAKKRLDQVEYLVSELGKELFNGENK